MVAEDINGDGKLDLVNNNGNVLAMLGNGDGTFQPPVTYATDQYTRADSGNIVAGDFNSDGIGDVGIIFGDSSTGTTDASLYLSEPTYAVFPRSINFGSVILGKTSSPMRVALANVGNGNLSLSSMTATGDFIEQSNCSKKLTIEKSCEIEVHFHPQSKGSLIGEITIKDNALATPQKISLTGIGK
ncbi:MAG: choice-of-anchor D domain-containing protein [Candidatus Sulfotelmatobacter sp.]